MRSQCRNRLSPRRGSDSTAICRPGGHEYQCVTPVDDGLNNRLLGAAKAGVTEGLLENVEGGAHDPQYTGLPVVLAFRQGAKQAFLLIAKGAGGLLLY